MDTILNEGQGLVSSSPHHPFLSFLSIPSSPILGPTLTGGFLRSYGQNVALYGFAEIQWGERETRKSYAALLLFCVLALGATSMVPISLLMEDRHCSRMIFHSRFSWQVWKNSDLLAWQFWHCGDFTNIYIPLCSFRIGTLEISLENPYLVLTWLTCRHFPNLCRCHPRVCWLIIKRFIPCLILEKQICCNELNAWEQLSVNGWSY